MIQEDRGATADEELEPIATAEELDEWQPPATLWRWGMGVPVESIRFAASILGMFSMSTKCSKALRSRARIGPVSAVSE